MKLITHRPMNRVDWAWLMAAVIFGLFCAGLAIAPELFNGGPRQVSNFNFETGKWEDSVKPAYTSRITIETSGDVKKMLQAVHDIDPDSFAVPSSDHPRLTGADCASMILGGVFSMIMISFLFRITVKICERILGIFGVKPLNDEIMRDPSTSSR